MTTNYLFQSWQEQSSNSWNCLGFPEMSKHSNVFPETVQLLQLVATSLSGNSQSVGAVAFSSGRRLSSPRWRRCFPLLYLHFRFRIHLCFCMHPGFAKSKLRGRSGNYTTILTCYTQICSAKEERLCWCWCCSVCVFFQWTGGGRVWFSWGWKG